MRGYVSRTVPTFIAENIQFLAWPLANYSMQTSAGFIYVHEWTFSWLLKCRNQFPTAVPNTELGSVHRMHGVECLSSEKQINSFRQTKR